MSRVVLLLVAIAAAAAVPARAQHATPPAPAAADPAEPAAPAAAPAPVRAHRLNPCNPWDPGELRRDPSVAELRCRYGAHGPGRFGLATYAEVPVYQPRTPMPGTHVVGVPGLPRPRPGESYEEWEWRVLRTEYGRSVLNVNRGLDVLDPLFASRIMVLERRLAEEGIRFVRRETWRSWDRQAFLFQQGRSRPGYLVTTTLTSWHSTVDAHGNPAGLAVDYTVPRPQMKRFHEIVWDVGLESYGPESNDAGHVYFPQSETFPMPDLILLRLLPRVPGVTLATGRPVDEPVTREKRAEYRRAAEDFASLPFFTPARVELAGAGVLDLRWTEEATAPEWSPPAPAAAPRPAGAVPALIAWIKARRASRW